MFPCRTASSVFLVLAGLHGVLRAEHLQLTPGYPEQVKGAGSPPEKGGTERRGEPAGGGKSGPSAEQIAEKEMTIRTSAFPSEPQPNGGGGGASERRCSEPVEPNPEPILGGIMLELMGLFKMTHNYFHAALRSAVALVLLEKSFVSDTTQFRGANLGRC